VNELLKDFSFSYGRSLLFKEHWRIYWQRGIVARGSSIYAGLAAPVRFPGRLTGFKKCRLPVAPRCLSVR
jgi:hypothetical protein